MKLPEKGYKRDFVVFGYFIIIFSIVLLAFGVVIKLLLPFVSAWFVALLLQPIVKRARSKTGWSEKASGILAFSLVMTLLGIVIFLVCKRIYVELRSLSLYVGENYEDIASRVTSFVKGISEKLHGGTGEDSAYIYDMLSRTLKSSLSELAVRSTDAIGGFLGALPYFFFAAVIFIMSCFYFCADFDKINKALVSILPKRFAKRRKEFQEKVLSGALKYIKAYVILFLITFVALMIGFVIIGEKYATLLAAVVALLDVLPVIGVGTVLIPWVIVLFALGQVKKAVILLVVCVIVMIGRQIIEPHIVGSQLGVHPLLTLVSVFAGYKLFGLFGFIVGPIALVIIKNLYFFVIKILADR